MKPEENGESGPMKVCETPGCEKEARLQCPTCIKLQIKVSLTNILKSQTQNSFRHFSGLIFLQSRMLPQQLESPQSFAQIGQVWKPVQ